MNFRDSDSDTPSEGCTTIKGRLFAPSGKPVAKRLVWFISTSYMGSCQTDPEKGFLDVAETDQDGQFTLTLGREQGETLAVAGKEFRCLVCRSSDDLGIDTILKSGPKQHSITLNLKLKIGREITGVVEGLDPKKPHYLDIESNKSLPEFHDLATIAKDGSFQWKGFPDEQLCLNVDREVSYNPPTYEYQVIKVEEDGQTVPDPSNFSLPPGNGPVHLKVYALPRN